MLFGALCGIETNIIVSYKNNNNMLLVHRSHLGVIKSASDYMWINNTPITYWRYKYLKGEKGSLEDMKNMLEDVKVVFFSLPSWEAWLSFGDAFYVDLPEDTIVSVGVAEMFHTTCNLKDVEAVILDNSPYEFLQVDKLEIVVPLTIVKQYYLSNIV